MPGNHKFNGAYSGDYLNFVAFPLGGIGAGMICLDGTDSSMIAADDDICIRIS